jgi:hypothetical protein
MTTTPLSRHPRIATSDIDQAREEVAAAFCPHRLSLTSRTGRLGEGLGWRLASPSEDGPRPSRTEVSIASASRSPTRLPCRSCRTRMRHGPLRGGPAIPATFNSRPVISRGDMAIAFGASRQSLYLWYRDRAVTGHPEPAGTIGGTTYWYEDEWTAWYESRQLGKRERLTRVDRGGDPDDLVDADEAARIMGYSGRAVIHGNVRLGATPPAGASWRCATSRLRSRPQLVPCPASSQGLAPADMSCR